MTSSIEDIQKLLTLMAYIAEKALYLAGQSLFGRRQDAFGEIEKKHSQLIRLRKELEEQVSTHIGAELPTGRDVKRLLLITPPPPPPPPPSGRRSGSPCPSGARRLPGGEGRRVAR